MFPRPVPPRPAGRRLAVLALVCAGFVSGGSVRAADAPVSADVAATTAQADAELAAKAAKFVAPLKLDDAAKSARVEALIVAHLRAVRDWHNAHPASSVPAGFNPATGQKLSELDRAMIADSAMPRAVHETLMAGLRAELTEPQVETILDGYTIGKVEFTLRGYRAIVPDLTAQEEATILGFLKQAREQAIDFKGMNQISAVFEIYKTKSEQYLNANGRNWKALYKAYSDAAKAKKAADAAAAKATGAPAAPGPAAP